MTVPIRTAAVIGSGVMGAGIAAHLANAGIPTLLLDRVPEEPSGGRSRLAADAIVCLARTKPAPLYDEAFAARITPGNLEDDLHKIGGVDWVIEAVVENLDVKRDLLKRIEGFWKPGQIVSSNTSGISIREMAEGCSDDFRSHFLGVHFFNPPRYMKLVEIIPGADTEPSVVSRAADFCAGKLGKGVVYAKDTPNFIANRIGTYGLLATLRLMMEKGFTVEEIDAVTGPALGRPKSATFRTLDLVGLDTFIRVADNVFGKLQEGPEREMFAVPRILLDMAGRGWNGEKAGQGFYKKVKSGEGSEILSLDLASLDYRKKLPVSSASLEAAKQAKGAQEKIKALLAGRDRYAELAWELLKKTLVYSAEKIGEIADSITEIDRAMKWGFHWELGPFELWDAIGLPKSVARMEAEGTVVPGWVKDWVAAGNAAFYRRTAGTGETAFLYRGAYRTMEEPPEHISLRSLKERNAVIRGNTGASLLDIGDGVACLEFHSPNNAIGADILHMIRWSIEEVRAHYDALVIANEGRHFCVGANLLLLLMEAQDEEWEEIDGIIRLFQDTMMLLKHFEKPVIAAPHHMTLGGGVEVCMPADEVVAYAETYCGLVEAGVGLIPAGGGCKEIALRISRSLPHPEWDLQPMLNEMFMTVGMAKVSGSAFEAKRLRYFQDNDRIVTNRDRLIHEAKQSALRLVQAGYTPPEPPKIRVAGADGKAVLKLGAYNLHQGGSISEHDLLIAGRLAHVMAGGDVPAGTMVSEQYMLDLEREAFLSLCGEPKTRRRMQHMLAKGKPLRN